MNQTSKELRLAVKEVYDSQSVSFSDCYELEKLKPIRVIFVPNDAPRYVSAIADFLQTKVKKKYPELSPEIVFIEPLFHTEGDWGEIVCKSLASAARYLQNNALPFGQQSVILCSSDMVAEILLKKRGVTQDYDAAFIPRLICDVDSFKSCTGPLDLAAHKASVSPEILIAYEPYHKKVPTFADALIVLASGYECWGNMLDVWHQICERYGQRAKIVYIDDLEQWTSKDYAAKIFAKFSWLVKKTKIADRVEKFPPHAYTVVGRLDQQKSIFFLPQKKSFWVYNLRQASSLQDISFWIYRQEFNDEWAHAGAISRQFLCQDMKNLEEATKTKLQLDRFQLNKRFSKWNLRLFWWNYQICIKNYCWINFLSD